MSIQATAWAWEQSNLKPAPKLCLIYLSNCASESNNWCCWPSYSGIEKFTGLSRQGVANSLKTLQAAGLIEKIPGQDTERLRDDFGITEKRSNVYRIVMDPPAQVVNSVDHQTDPGSQLSLLDQSTQLTRVVNSVDPNLNRTVNEPEKKITVRSHLTAVLSEEMTKAVIEHRRAIKHPLSAFSAKDLAHQFSLCQDPNAAAAMMINRSWRGFRAEWYLREQSKQNDNGGLNYEDNSVEAARARLREGSECDAR